MNIIFTPNKNRMAAYFASIFAVYAGSAQSASDIASETDSRIMDQIIVTAQKREESLLEVPVPVTAVAATALADQSKYRIQDYYSKVPGLSISSSELAPTVAIRGIIAGAGGNPTTGIILDDMPLGSATSLGGGYFAPELDPNDLQRIEVLRGPQGTLYGASSIGGLLKYVTAEPSIKAFTGRIQAGLNGVEQGGMGYNLSGRVNIPVSETAAITVSGFSRHEAGYIDNVSLGGDKDINETDIHGGRIAAVLRPSDDLKIKLAALYQKNDVGGFAYITTHLTDDLDVSLGDLEQGFIPNSGGNTRTFKAYTAQVDYSIGNFDFVSITGFSDSNFTDILDYSILFGDPESSTGAALSFDDSTTEKFTQEFRLTTSFGENVDLLFGAYFGREDSPWDSIVYNVNLDGSRNSLNGTLLWNTSLDEDAVFSNLSIQLTDKFDVQIGARYAEIDQSYEEVDNFYVDNEVIFTDITPDSTFSDEVLTYLFTPRYKFSEDVMVYFRLASGYRPGGINSALSSGQPTANPYSPDETKNFEFGLKGRALNRTLIYDLSIYHIDWTDVQILLTDSENFLGYFANGGDSESQGIELAIEYSATSQLSLSGWITVSDAKITDDLSGDARGVGNDRGASGSRLPYSSEVSASIAATYEFNIGDYDAAIGGDVSYVGDRVGDFLTYDGERAHYDSYTELNLSAGLTSKDWTFSFYVNNISDKRGLVGGGAGTTVERSFQVIQPRTVGLSVSKSFE